MTYTHTIAIIAGLPIAYILFMAYKEFMDARRFYRFYKMGAEYRKSVIEEGYRFDWIGRIYRFIEIPKAVKMTYEQQQQYVYGQLTLLWNLVLTPYAVGSICHYEFIPVSEDTILVVVSTRRKILRPWLLIPLFLYTGLLCYLFA